MKLISVIQTKIIESLISEVVQVLIELLKSNTTPKPIQLTAWGIIGIFGVVVLAYAGNEFFKVLIA